MTSWSKCAKCGKRLEGHGPPEIFCCCPGEPSELDKLRAENKRLQKVESDYQETMLYLDLDSLQAERERLRDENKKLHIRNKNLGESAGVRGRALERAESENERLSRGELYMADSLRSALGRRYKRRPEVHWIEKSVGAVRAIVEENERLRRLQCSGCDGNGTVLIAIDDAETCPHCGGSGAEADALL